MAAKREEQANRGAGLTEQVRGAVIWRSGSQIVAQAVSWVATLFVIRLLAPSDYGLFAMTQAVLAFMAFLSGYGFAGSLIRAETVEPFRVRQVFGMLLLLNGGLALAQIAVAPLAADYFGQPLIADMLRWQSLIYLATPFSVLPEVLMTRRMDFRQPAIITIASTALGAATAVTMALSGAGVWTLVAAPIVIFWSRAIGMIMASRLFILPSFDFRGAGATFGFGSALLLSQGFWVIQSQADMLIAGRLFDPHRLGLYAEALFLTQIFATRFVPALNEVAFPAYAQLQHDRERLARSFLKAVQLITAVVLPVYLGLAVTSAEAVETLFGPKWVEMAPLVSILALAMPLMTLQILVTPALNALGKQQVGTGISFCGALIMPTSYLIGVRAGIEGLAWSWLAGFALLTAITYVAARRHAGIPIGGVVRAVAPNLAAALIMAGVVWLVKIWLPAMPTPAALGILVTAGAASYFALLRVIAPDVVAAILDLARSRTGRPLAANA